MSNYARQAGSALRMLTQKGQPMQLLRFEIEDYDPVNPENNQISFIGKASSYGIVLPATQGTIEAFDDRILTDPNQRRKFRYVLLAGKGLSSAPQGGDILATKEGYYQVIGSTPLDPTGDTPIIYNVGCTLDLKLARNLIDDVLDIDTPPPTVEGVINTGTAIAEDVALGKTFSSSLLTNVAGTSTRNATITDTSIQPPQAAADCTLLEALTAIGSGVLLDWSNRGITAVNALLLEKLNDASNNAYGRGVYLRLAGNPIESGNEFLATLVSNGYPNGYFDLTGIPVTPVHVDGVWTVTFSASGSVLNGQAIILPGQSNNLTLLFGEDAIGGADDFVGYINGLNIGWVATMEGDSGVVVVTVFNNQDLPLSPSTSANLIGVIDTAVGTAQNGDKTTLEDISWTIVT